MAELTAPWRTAAEFEADYRKAAMAGMTVDAYAAANGMSHRRLYHWKARFEQDLGRKLPSMASIRGNHFGSQVDASETGREKLAALMRENQQLKVDNKRLGSVSIDLEVIRRIIGRIDAKLVTDAPAWSIKASGKKIIHGTPTLMLSDLHFGEVVFPSQVNNVNQYNTAIAKARLKRVVVGAVKLLRETLSPGAFGGMVCILGGDMVEGTIHDELRDTSDETVCEAVITLHDELVPHLKALCDEFGLLHVPCVVGNHGRLDRKPRMKNGPKLNYDWLLYHFIARTIGADPKYRNRITFQIPEGFEASYKVFGCVAAGTKVLTKDLRWVLVESLRAGDELLGFDAELPDGIGRGRTRRWRPSRVVGCHVEKRPAVRVLLENGDTITCTPDHPLLCGTTYGNATRWVEAAKLRPGWRVKRYLKPWDEETSKAAGWLAGMFDGEGSLSVHGRRRATSLRIAQNPGAVEQRISEALASFGFASETYAHKKCYVKSVGGGLSEKLRFLGSVRPERLIAKWNALLDEHGASMEAIEAVAVVSVEDAGMHDIVVMGTTSETYVSDGYASHNTRYMLTHGDSFKGGDGISGPLMPWMRGSLKASKSYAAMGMPFDVMVMGHWHQLRYLGPIIVNGSLVGYNEYAQKMHFGFEPPQQALWLTHPARGLTFQEGVFADEPKAQGERDWISVHR